MNASLPTWAQDALPVTMDGAASLLGVSRRFLVDTIRRHPHFELRGTKKVFYPEHIKQLAFIVSPPKADTPLQVVRDFIRSKLSAKAADDMEDFFDREVTGTVYLIRCAGRVKIGFATDFAQRMRVLRTACPFPVETIATMPGDRTLELLLHRCFVGLRRHGEWFEEITDLAALVEALAKLEGDHEQT